MSSQTDRIYRELETIRPFAATANELFLLCSSRIPKVSVNRALNELAARGKVMKLDKYKDGGNGRKTRLWRATYK